MLYSGTSSIVKKKLHLNVRIFMWSHCGMNLLIGLPTFLTAWRTAPKSEIPA